MEDVFMENFQIREIALTDAKAIQRIRSLISKEDADVDSEKIINQQTGGISNRASLVALIDNKVVGYMISNVLHAGFGLQKSAWIVAMGVDPGYMVETLTLSNVTFGKTSLLIPKTTINPTIITITDIRFTKSELFILNLGRLI
jgi:hypothetical protein